MDLTHKNDSSRQNKKHPLRTARRFRLSFINDNTFNEIWTIRMSQKKVVALAALLIVAFGSTIAMLIVFTPIKTFLPGYLKQSQRQENIVNSMRVDSMMTQLRITQSYTDNLRRILKDDPASETDLNSVENLPASLDSLTPSSDAEKEFVKQYDKENRYNVNILSSITPEGLSLHNPVPQGTLATSSDNTGYGELRIIAPDKSPVLSALGGTVIDTYYSPTRQNTVIVQHSDGLISKYTGMPTVFVSVGSKVEKGSPLGLMTVKQGHVTLPLTFELWNKGTKLNPLDYIQW
ncbi:MAG: M23 family metallopeptidase [Muribaculum sp.]|nr:M23 family metallopeptidase [Muribaculum sp.]